MEKFTLEEIHRYWRKICNRDFFNAPFNYVKVTPQRSWLLSKLTDNFFPNKNIKVLEIGCNVGRNLFVLLSKGYKDLSGVEINSEAVKHLKNSQLKDKVTIYSSSIEDCIGSFSDNQFDLVFTMAVLEHIHPDSEWVFKEIARITKGLITIEDELNVSLRVFKRNYFDVFSKLDMKQEVMFNLEDLKDDDLYGFIARVFKKNA